MYPDISYSELEEKLKTDEYVLIDVRTPDEYAQETIPGAINVPLFSNEERAIVGTAYKQLSVDEAKMIGVEAVAKRLPDMFKTLLDINKNHKHLVFFCARGGFRSGSVVAFLQSLHISALKLQGGYKAYRAYVNERLPEVAKDIELIVLYGNTGTGKTQVLEALKAKGADVLDLEGCANHRGSTLGAVGLGEPNTQKMFDALLYEELKDRKGNLVFTEGESKRIGRSVIPDYLFEKIRSGIHVEITAPMDIRVENIVGDYVYETDHELIEALNHLRKRLGNDRIDQFIELVRQNDYRSVARDLMIEYYDPMYEHNPKNYVFHVENLEPEKSAEILINEFMVESGK
jgi:tRNA 2-selenouridine synthase